MKQFHTGTSGIGGTGIEINVTDQEGLLKDIAAHLQSQRGFQIATLNLDHVVKLRQSPSFAEAYRAHSHVTADGNPIVWTCRLSGQDVSLVQGSDLVMPLARLAADMGVPVTLLGSSDATLAGAADVLRARCPGLRIADLIAPPMGFEPEGALASEYIARLKQSEAGLCFLALGAPKQELFAAAASRVAPQVGFVSIGAGLDFLAGHQIRAPRMVRMFAMEWAWRLGQSPRRMAGRYAACFAILPRLLAEALVLRWRGHPSG